MPIYNQAFFPFVLQKRGLICIFLFAAFFYEYDGYYLVPQMYFQPLGCPERTVVTGLTDSNRIGSSNDFLPPVNRICSLFRFLCFLGKWISIAYPTIKDFFVFI